MQAFDYDRAKKELNIPADYTVEAMIAIGKPDAIDSLPSALQKKEELSVGKEIEEFVFKGEFKEKNNYKQKRKNCNEEADIFFNEYSFWVND